MGEYGIPVELIVKHGLDAKRAGHLHLAEWKLREAVELDPDNVQAHWVLAWTLAALDRKAEAAEEFRKVIEVAPDGQMKQEAQAALERMQ